MSGLLKIFMNKRRYRNKDHKPVERREKELVVNRAWLECVYLMSLSELKDNDDITRIGAATLAGFLLGYDLDLVVKDIVGGNSPE